MSYDSKFLRWRMEQVWLQRGCVNPNHLNRWFTYERGYRVYDKAHLRILLWVDKGKRMTSTRGCKPKGKGFSFLPKNYGLRLKVLAEQKAGLKNCHCHLPHHLPIWWCPVHGEVTVPMD